MPEEKQRAPRRAWTDDNVWEALKEAFREWPEARRKARVELLEELDKELCKSESKEPAKPAQDTLGL